MKRLLSGIFTLCALVVWGLAMPSPAAAATTTQSVGFPMYEYPTIGNLWQDIFDASEQVPWIIANPGNGPGASVNSDYTTYLNNMPDDQRAIGYVYTTYHTRDISEVLSDIDDWYDMYPQVSGIFVDLVKNGAAAADVCYAATLHNYVKSKHPNDLVVMNPGANIEFAYEPYGDIFANAENTYTNYASWTPYTDGFENNASFASRFWHIVHTADAADLNDAIALTRTNNAGWVLITDEGMPNPYTAVASYWSTFLGLVDDLPQTTIPNRGLTALPAGCLDLSLATSRTTTTQTKQVTNTITNLVTNTDATRFSPGTTTVTYSMPSGASLVSLSGTGWSCSTNTRECSYAGEIAADTALPAITAKVIVGCGYTSGSVSITLNNFADNSATTNASVSKPGDCTDAQEGSTTDAGGSSGGARTTSTVTTTTDDTAPVEEPTVTTAPQEPESTTEPSSQFTPSTQEPPTEPTSATFNVVPVIIGGIVLLLAVGAGVWWWLARRSSNLPY